MVLFICAQLVLLIRSFRTFVDKTSQTNRAKCLCCDDEEKRFKTRMVPFILKPNYASFPCKLNYRSLSSENNRERKALRCGRATNGWSTRIATRHSRGWAGSVEGNPSILDTVWRPRLARQASPTPNSSLVPPAFHPLAGTPGQCVGGERKRGETLPLFVWLHGVMVDSLLLTAP